MSDEKVRTTKPKGTSRYVYRGPHELLERDLKERLDHDTRASALVFETYELPLHQVVELPDEVADRVRQAGYVLEEAAD